MDIATIIGFIAGTGLVIFGMSQGGGSLSTFIDIPSLAIVVGGGSAAVMICFPLPQVIGAMKVVKNAFMPQKNDSSNIISTIVSFAEKARREGLLTLEDDAAALDNEFLQ